MTAGRSSDYYDLAEQDYDLTRAAIKQMPPVRTPAMLSPERSRKFELMKAEYIIWASRLQSLSRRARFLDYGTFINGMCDETSRAVLVSGQLALQDVAPMELTRRILAARHTPSYGAQDLVDFGVMNSYYPGFVDTIGENDAVPALDDLCRGKYDFRFLRRAGGLGNADDKAWWKTGIRERPRDAVGVVRAVEAAEYLIRVPPLVRSKRSSHLEPQPVAGVVDVLGALNTLDKELEDIRKRTREDIRRRRGRLIYDFSRIYGSTGLTDEECEMLIDYERISNAEVNKRHVK